MPKKQVTITDWKDVQDKDEWGKFAFYRTAARRRGASGLPTCFGGRDFHSNNGGPMKKRYVVLDALGEYENIYPTQRIAKLSIQILQEKYSGPWAHRFTIHELGPAIKTVTHPIQTKGRGQTEGEGANEIHRWLHYQDAEVDES